MRLGIRRGPVRASKHRRIEILLSGLAAGVVGVLIGVALIYSHADQAGRIAADAELVESAGSALSAAAVTRSNLGIALTLTAGAGEGLSTAEQAQQARLETRRALDLLEERAAALATGSSDLTDLAAQISGSADRALRHSEQGDFEIGQTVAADETLPALNALTNSITQTQEQASSRIGSERADAGRVARLASFVVALFVPALAIWMLWIVARRRSQRIVLEEKLREERELVKAKDQFIANLSHEIRTPLTGIFGFATEIVDAIDSGKPLDETTVRDINALVASEASELTRMVEDLLVVAKAEEGRLRFVVENIEIGPVVDAILQPFRHRGWAIPAVLEPAEVSADRLRLRQVIRNLVSNAVHHGGPRIWVVGHQAEGRYVCIVADDGPGVPPEIEARLFERYVHEGGSPILTGSVGLGLSIARTLMQHMNGTLVYHRQAGITMFILDLESPLSQGSKIGADHLIDAVSASMPSPSSTPGLAAAVLSVEGEGSYRR